MVKTSQTGRHFNLPPMIIIYGVTDIGPIHDLLKEIVGDQYSMKLVANDQVEVQVKDKGKFGQVTAALKAKNSIFEVSKKNKKDTYKVILRNMHSSINTDIIVQELALHGHKVVSINNVKNTNTNEPTSFFHVELEPRENNEDIYSLTKLSNMIVAFEPRFQKKPSRKSQSSGAKDSSSDNAATGAKTSDTEAFDPSHPEISPNETSTTDTPVAYVQPIRSRTPKNRRQNSSASQNTASSNFTAQEQLATLNRLSNLEAFVNSTASSLESTLLLTVTLIRRVRYSES